MFVSIITPTYNRSNYLAHCYDSLCNQTCFDFEWIIIDDGSTDDTYEVVSRFKADRFNVVYVRKENGGKHTALNTSHDYINGDFILILDSDDYLTKDAIETIVDDWEIYDSKKEIACISYYKLSESGEVISGKLNCDYYESDHISYRVNNNIQGDQCEVVRSSVFKELIFPVYENERFASEGLLWNYIGYNYKTVYRNKAIYVCEYLDDGISKSGRKLLMRNPKGMIDLTKTFFDKRVVIKKRMKETILYIVYCFCDKRELKEIVLNSNNTLMVTTLLLPSCLVYKYWKYKYL